jgi:hypothetical protein
MIPEQAPRRANTIAGSSRTSPSPPHLRSISFDDSFIPPPVPPKDSPTLQPSYRVPEFYPIVSTWSIDSEEEEELRRRRERGDCTAPAPICFLRRARNNSKVIKRKLSFLTPRRDRSRRESLDNDHDDEVDMDMSIESGVDESQSSEWM